VISPAINMACLDGDYAPLANVLLRQAAHDAGADEPILVRDGHVTEGAASNVFVARDGTLATPARGHPILPGINRDVVIELAREAALACVEGSVPEPRLRGADEIWITSSTMEVLPVVQLDGQPVGAGWPGPLWERMWALFQEYEQQPAT